MSSSRRSSRSSKKQPLNTGDEFAVAVYSKNKKLAYTFGNPDFNTVVNKFLAQYPPPANGSTHAQDCATLAQLEKQLEVELARKKELDRLQKIRDAAMSKLSHKQLQDLKEKIMDFAKNLD